MDDHFPDATKKVDFISRQVAVQCASDVAADFLNDCLYSAFWGAQTVGEWMKDIPAADVVPAEQYKRLLSAARRMHTWIFLNSYDEQEAYDACGLTDEDNILLGYGGRFILERQQ